MEIFRSLALAAAVLWIGSTASAATVFSVDGPVGGSAAIGENFLDKGASQSFSVLQDLDNVSFGFDLRCLSCGGEIWLITDRPRIDATIFQQVAQATFSGFEEAQTALSGLSLNAGTVYSLIMSVDTGNAIWRGSQAPTFLGSDTIAAESDHLLLTALDPNFLPWSPTKTASGTLKFSISTDDVPAVPLPASVGFLIVGLVGFGALRKLHRRHA